MTEEKKVDESVETTETNSTEQDESTETKTVADEIAEQIAQGRDQESEATTEESEDNTEETSEPLAEESTAAEETDDNDDEDISSFLEESSTEKKDGLTKRVDKLTAEKYKDKAMIQELQARLDEREKVSPTKTKRFTDDQLAEAMIKAHEDGDKELMSVIFKQQSLQIKEDLRNEYEKEQKDRIEAESRNRTEWTEVVKDWGYLADESEAEIYSGSHQELNLNDPKSLLRQIALMLYNSQQEDMFQRYHRPGGQRLAVEDAFKAVLKKRRGTKSDNKETKSLKNRLTKEKRRKSLSGGSKRVKTEPEKKPTKKLTSREKIDEYINERRTTQQLSKEAGVK